MLLTCNISALLASYSKLQFFSQSVTLVQKKIGDLDAGKKRICEEFQVHVHKYLNMLTKSQTIWILATAGQ